MFNILLTFTFNFNKRFLNKNTRYFTYFFIFIIFYKFFKKTIKYNNFFDCSIRFSTNGGGNFVLLKAPFIHKKSKNILTKVNNKIILILNTKKKSFCYYSNLDIANLHFSKKINYLMHFFSFPGFHLYKLSWFIFTNLNIFFKKQFYYLRKKNLILLRRRYLLLSKIRFFY